MVWVLAAFLMVVGLLLFAANSGVVQAVASILFAIPSPTEHWAAIVGHLAWPLTIAWILIRFKHSIRRVIEILIIRFKTDDLSFGTLLQVNAKSTIVNLDATEDDATSDAYVTESLLEFMGNNDNLVRIQQWLGDQGRDALDVVEFITNSEYADLRSTAFAALVEGGTHG